MVPGTFGRARGMAPGLDPVSGRSHNCRCSMFFTRPSVRCRMKSDDIFFAKFAEITTDGLFTVVGGGLNKICADEFPWSWGFLYLLTRVRLTPTEALTQHNTSIERETPNGEIEVIGPESLLLPIASTAAETGPDNNYGLSFSFCLVNLLFPA